FFQHENRDNMLIVAVDTSIGGRTLCKPKFLEVLGITLNEFNDYVATSRWAIPIYTIVLGPSDSTVTRSREGLFNTCHLAYICERVCHNKEIGVDVHKDLVTYRDYFFAHLQLLGPETRAVRADTCFECLENQKDLAGSTTQPPLL
ncbi:hypothetical protein PFISCL1PPCAC_4988, partial [Pristionchus fissidentatus]